MPTTPLQVRRVSLDSLHPDPANARQHGPDNLEAIVASLKRFGQAEPLVVHAKSGRVIGGNGRLTAMKKLGWTECDVVELDLDDLTATALGIALNRTADLAAWDEPALAKLLGELEAQNSLDGVGYSVGDLAELTAKLESDLPPEDLDDPGPEEPPVVPTSRTGDLWLLGDHRLLCGDSTKADDIARLLDGEKAALLSTDPPYCVDYTGMDRPIHDGKPSGKDWSHVYREVDIKDLGEFLDAVFCAALPHVIDEAAIYVWHAHLQYPVIAATFEKHDLLLHQSLIWVKPTATFGHSYYRWRHEPCAFGWKRGHKPKHGYGDMDSVWEVDWEGKSRVVGNEHPCLHPEALVLTEAGYRPIQSIAVGDRVYAADGAFYPVTDVSSHPYTSGNLFRIVAKGGNIATLASDNHPFLTWRPERKRRHVLGGAVSWIRADELQVGDYLMTPVMDPNDADPFPENDEDYWFLFGLYVAQGHTQRAGHGANRYPSFALHKKRQDLIGRIRDNWESVGEYDSCDYGQISQGVTVMAFDPQAGAQFEELGGRYAHAKRLAPIVLRLPESKRRAVLEGWLNGDGCRVHNRSYWQGKTCSADLAAHLALIGESVGYGTNVFLYDPPAEAPVIRGRKIQSQRPVYNLYFYARDPQLRNYISHLEHEGRTYRLRYVKKVERVPYQGNVWNLSVDGSPSFQTAVGMSHNTQKPTRLFEIPMEQHTKAGAIVLEPFSGSGSQLIAAEKLHRRCRAMEISPAFVDVALRRWEKSTGKTALLHGTEMTFEEVAKERAAIASKEVTA